MRKIGYAIIGFGGIAESRIAKEGFGIDRNRFAGHPQAELMGVTDANPARKEAARALGLKWYNTVREVLSDPRIEAVFIATNNRSHAPIAEEAIEAGRHCLIEKPIATTLEDAQRLQRLSRQHGVSLAADHMMTKNAYNQRAKDLIDTGAIGQVNDIVLHMEFCYGSAPDEAASWRCADPGEVGGPIGDVGSHCLYMAE
ncbi:MAG: Gfo/Idh/MocA family protein, partial [Planctomycetota bacterium]